MKKIFTLIIALAMVAGAQAQTTVSPKVAAQKAAGLFAKYSNVSAAKGANATTAAEPQLAYVSVLNGDTCFYVFDNPQGGYAIIGGDLAAREVLATVDNGSFDINSIPVQEVSLLNKYAMQIKAAKQAGLGTPVVTAQPFNINPLCTATWGQEAPYHNFTPILPSTISYFVNQTDDDGVSYGDGKHHAATGCVATAAAQALYTLYKKSKDVPAHISQNISEVLNFCDEEDNVLGQTGTLTFGTDEAINWNVLTDKYTDAQTDAAAVQVGRLMYLMGLISKMGYGISSGAETTELQAGLQTYMGMTDAKYLSEYDKDGKMAVDENTWESTVFSELESGRPVIFTGNAADGKGGHCFLCDGYQKGDNLFHFNWGWANAGDGWFALHSSSAIAQAGEGSLLKPQTGGSQTGGQGDKTTYDFSAGNEIVYNLIYKGNDKYVPSAINAISANDSTVAPATKKVLKNGQFIIVKDGKQFNAAGQQM